MDASDDLLDVVFAAVDHAIESLEGGGPLIPFVQVQKGEELTLARFMGASLEESVEEARRSVGTLEKTVTRAALAYDGFLTLEGKKYDAVFVEGFERGKPNAVVFAQRYRLDGKRVESIGNVAYVDNAENLLAG